MDATAEDGVLRVGLPSRGSPGALAGYGHALVRYDSAETLLAATTPFVEEGLRAGDLVVLACPPETAALITEPFGRRAAGIETDPRLCLQDTRVPDAFVAVRSALRRAAGRGSGRVRVFGQGMAVDPPGGAREYLRYEISCNAVLAGAPLSALCGLDTTALPKELVELAVDAHPQLTVGDAVLDNARFREPASYLRALPVPVEPVMCAAPVLAVDGATVLAELRGRLRVTLADAVPDVDQREDLLLAVSEVAANAFRHGRPPVAARLWSDGRRMVCQITDSGRGYDDPLAGYQPAHGEDLAHGGMGLWLARKLWDSVELLGSDGAGLSVRLGTDLI